ncbi:MAG TPA: hypothetical protein VEK08_06165 [Planctomycetota bacterium]|nr:hypothetical protein [Planctomycetota bacterium]
MAEPASKRFSLRRLLRVSLGTLLLLVLLGGSIATAWWRWEPWVQRSTIASEIRGRLSFAADGELVAVQGTGWDRITSACHFAESGAKTDHLPFQTLSPDGRYAICFSSEAQQFNLMDVHSRTILPLLTVREEIPIIRFSPNSQRLLINNPETQTLQVWRVNEKRETFSTPKDFIPIASAEFTPDSRYVVILRRNGRVSVFDAEAGELKGMTRASKFNAHFVVVSPDSKCLLAAGADASVWLYTLPELKYEMDFHVPNDYVFAAAFSTDSRMIAVSQWSGDVRIYGRGTKDLHSELSTSGARANCLAFSPDGLRLLAGCNDSSIREWDAQGRQSLYIPPLAQSESFSPPVIVDAREEPDIPDEPDGVEEIPPGAGEKAWNMKYSGQFEQALEVRYLDGGQMISATTADKRTQLWDAGNGENIEVCSGRSIVALCRDGRRAAVLNEEKKTYEIWDLRRKHSQNRLTAQPEIWMAALFAVLLAFTLFRNFRSGR